MHLLGTISRNDGFIGIIIINFSSRFNKNVVRIHHRDYAKRKHPPLNDIVIVHTSLGKLRAEKPHYFYYANYSGGG